MSTSNAASTTGPVAARILRVADRTPGRVFTLDDLQRAGVEREPLREALHRLASTGQVERVERGTYVVMPRSGRVPLRPLDLVGAWFANEPHSVVGRAAAEYHRLTLDTASTIEVLLTRAKEPTTYQGATYVFGRRPATSVSADNVRTKGSQPTSVASPGKLVVLLLDASPTRRSQRPERGLALVTEVLQRGGDRGLWQRVDWPALVRRHGSTSAARRLGFLLEHNGLPVSDELEAMRGESGSILLSPMYPAQGDLDRKWRVWVNDPVVAG